jgi:hypothetical protein
MDEHISEGVRGILATGGEFLSDNQVIHLTNTLMAQCVARKLTKTNIWRVIRHSNAYAENTVEWLHYSVHRPTVDDVFDGGFTFDPAENTIEIEGPFDFFQAAVIWPFNQIVFDHYPEPATALPYQINASNYAKYVNTCGQCGLVIGGKQDYFCEPCQVGTCIQCRTDLIEASAEDPEEEDYLLCETCDGEYPIP